MIAQKLILDETMVTHFTFKFELIVTFQVKAITIFLGNVTNVA